MFHHMHSLYLYPSFPLPQADRLSHTWASELEQKLREQEAHYQKELAKAMAQLRGVESMVDSVIDAGMRVCTDVTYMYIV